MFSSPLSRLITLGLISLAALILLLGTFSVGLSIGERKARHTADWCQNYGDLFRPAQPMPMGKPFMRLMLPPAHGVFGKVLSASGSSLMIQGKDGIEQSVLVTSSTLIRINRSQGELSDLRQDTEVSVLGTPNLQGQIEAHLIRILQSH